MKKFFKKFLSTIITYTFAVFTVLFFAPLEIYLGNILDFKIFANSAVFILLVLSVAATLVLSAGLSFLPVKILKIMNIGVFSLSLCFYIQSLFLNGKLISLTGDEQTFSALSIVSNALIWIVVIAIIFVLWQILKKAKKEKAFLTAVKFISLSLVIMQTVGLVSVYSVCDKYNASKNCYFSNEGKLEVSNNKNVLYFVIDTCSGNVVEKALSESPDIFDDLDGFIYYPNASSTYSRTYPSITYMLSGEKCYFDIPASEYVNNAFEKSKFIPTMKDLKTDVRLYTETAYIGESVKNKIDNLSYSAADVNNINFLGFVKKSVKISLFRGAPYIIKERFKYTAEEVNKEITKSLADKALLFDDLEFYDEIKNDRVKVNKNYNAAFRFYHMFGTHPGATVNENVEYESGVAPSDTFKGNIKILKEYFKQLKDLGVYDKSTIIITADHGSSGGGSTLDIPTNTGCIMLVKPANAKAGEKFKVSSAPVCHEDLFATAIHSLGGDYSQFGRNIYEIRENEQRKRLYYYSALYSATDGEIVLREYSLKGNARVREDYAATGKYWDINYSMNNVSKKRFE